MDWTDKLVKAQTDERAGLPDIIPTNYGNGITFQDNTGTSYTTDVELPRTLHVTISSWIGVSIGAEHYYAKIAVMEPYLIYESDGKKQRSIIGGVIDNYKPDEAQSFDISIYRPLTSTEIEENPDRWDYYKAGNLVSAFEDEDTLHKAVIECIKARFAGDWLVEIEGFENEDYNINWQQPLAVNELK